MYITNLEIIINILNQKINKDKLLEYGYFIAVENIDGNYKIKFINEIKNNKSYSLENPKLFIPKEQSCYFLMWCKKIAIYQWLYILILAIIRKSVYLFQNKIIVLMKAL